MHYGEVYSEVGDGSSIYIDNFFHLPALGVESEVLVNASCLVDGVAGFPVLDAQNRSILREYAGRILLLGVS